MPMQNKKRKANEIMKLKKFNGKNKEIVESKDKDCLCVRL